MNKIQTMKNHFSGFQKVPAAAQMSTKI